MRVRARIVQTTAMTDSFDEDGAVKSTLEALDRELLDLLIKRFDLIEQQIVDQQKQGITRTSVAESSHTQSSDSADIALTLQTLGFADASRDFSPSHSSAETASRH